MALVRDAVPLKEIVRRTGHSRKLVRQVSRGESTDVFRTRQSTLDAAEMPITTTLLSISVEYIPSQGRAGLLTRPNLRKSSSTGFSRSIGTIMLTCSALPSRSSWSDPMPINSPRFEISPVPPVLREFQRGARETSDDLMSQMTILKDLVI
jgi:hypothetical protein